MNFYYSNNSTILLFNFYFSNQNFLCLTKAKVLFFYTDVLTRDLVFPVVVGDKCDVVINILVPCIDISIDFIR